MTKNSYNEYNDIIYKNVCREVGGIDSLPKDHR
jgi:hypothetical protein